LELVAIALLGVAPVLLMQIRRPFCIFSLLFLALKPAILNEDQRRLLTLFRRWWVRLVAVLVPLPLVWALLALYPVAVVASDITPFAEWGRFGGVAIAAGSFLMANLFWQVPISVLLVMATAEKRFQATSPYPVEQISQDFTQIGLLLSRILPTVLLPGTVAQPAQAHPSPVPDVEPSVALSNGQKAFPSAAPLPEVTAAVVVPAAAEPTLTEPVSSEPDVPDSVALAGELRHQAEHASPAQPSAVDSAMPDNSTLEVEVAVSSGASGGYG
jgi:hypothetical protein